MTEPKSRYKYDGDFAEESEYPTEEELKVIAEWDVPKQSVHGLLDYIKSLWWYPEEGFVLTGKRVLRLKLHTWGWSGNEEIVEALMHSWFWYFYWEESRRGGHYKFRVPVPSKRQR